MAVELKRMQSLYGTAAAWAAAAPIVPLRGEVCVEESATEPKLKVGDGTTAYASLPYVTGKTDAEVNTLADARIAAQGVTTSAGAADAGKLGRLDSGGKWDSSMIPAVTGGVTWKGDRDTTAAAPGGPSLNDIWVVDTAGAADASWTGIGAVVLAVGDLVIYDGTEWHALSAKV